ncbi:MAG: GAF domain-containing SpoIIE family protein phosphatase [Planctomycetota bacterium]
MKAAPPRARDEQRRLADLRALRLLDTPPEQRFDAIVALTKELFDVPIAYIALIDAERQWFKAQVGLDASETPRDISFCGHTILRSQPLIIPDASADARFCDNPMVLGEPYVRFYAGHPLRSPEGQNVATLCVVDRKPRSFTREDEALLARLAHLAETQFDLMDVIGAQRQLLDARRRIERELGDAERYVRSFLPPLHVGLNAHERPDYQYIASSELGGDLLGFFAVDDDHFSMFVLDVTGHGVGASLLAVSVGNAIRSAASFADPHDPADLLERLNEAFPMERHDNRFTTAWLGSYRRSDRVLRYATAGHHAALLTTPDGQKHELGEPALMLGATHDPGYENREHTLSVGDRLYLFSDGLFEVRGEDDAMLGHGGLTDMIQEPFATDNRTRVQQIIDRVRSLQGKDTFVDDVSLLEVEFA